MSNSRCHFKVHSSFRPILFNGQVPAELSPTEVGDYDGDGIADLMVKFDRAATYTTLAAGDVVHISVAGQLSDGAAFEGTDTVRVMACSPKLAQTLMRG